MQERRPDRACLTIATGRDLYLRMAFNLARSFLLWHRESDIKFFIATDQRKPPPPDLSQISIIPLQPKQYGSGFSPKLHLNKIAPAPKTLFIDADCLCVGNLEYVFERFHGRAVSAVGSIASTGEWFGDLRTRCERFKVPAVPVFVGALYYIEQGEICNAVFEYARRVESDYDRDGFVRLRNVPNEEPLISIAMARFGQEPIPEDGAIKADAMLWTQIHCDLLRGIAKVEFQDRKNSLLRGFRSTADEATQICHPRILHFNDRFSTIPPYTSEVLAMNLVRQMKLGIYPSRVISLLVCRVPHWTETRFKDALRPLYRRILGTRSVRSAR